MAEVAEEDALLEAEDTLPSDDDKDDDDFQGDEEASDEGDLDYVGEVEKEIKEPNKRKVRKEREKDDTTSNKSLKRKRKEIKDHQKMFTLCEVKLLPIAEKLKSAVDEKTVLALLEELDDTISEITPSFIRKYKFGMTMKGIRTKFSESQAVKDSCKQITKRMKTIFETKKEIEPIGFEPVLRKEKC